jgi:hypothetical protein
MFTLDLAHKPVAMADALENMVNVHLLLLLPSFNQEEGQCMLQRGIVT